MSQPHFNESNAKADLHERTAYEAHLLEAIYEVAQRSLNGGDHVTLRPNGGPFEQTIFLGSIKLSDPYAAFLKEGSPLILSLSFKLLDMLVEWVLAHNKIKVATSRFKEKKKELQRANVIFPDLIYHHDISSRMIRLYEFLEPLRGTIIHDRLFTSQDGALEVTSTKPGIVPYTLKFSEKDLRNLALLMVTLIRCLEGSWAIGVQSGMQIRYLLDNLRFIHGMPALGQLEPKYKRIRKYVLDEDPIDIDLHEVREAAQPQHGFKRDSVYYDLRVVAVSPDGKNHTVYLVQYDELVNLGDRLQTTRAELQLSPDCDLKFFNPASIAEELARSMQK